MPFVSRQLFCYAKQLAEARTKVAHGEGATSAVQQLEKLARDRSEQERSAFPPMPASDR